MRVLVDENFRGAIIRGLLRRQADLDIVRVVDVGLQGADDPAVLEWAAKEQRVLLTHDVTTLIGFAYERVAAHLPMPGVIEVSQDLPIGAVIDDLLLLMTCSKEHEWEGQVLFLPLR